MRKKKEEKILEPEEINVEVEENNEEYLNPDNDCYFDLDTKELNIRFDRIFNRPDIEYATKFKITRNKKIYIKQTDKIVNDYLLIINNVPDFLYFIMNIKYEIIKVKEQAIDNLLLSGDLPKKIKTREDYYNSKLSEKLIIPDDERKRLIDLLYEIVDEDDLFEFINDFVDDSYTLNLDEIIEINNKKGKNSEYAITDRVNKIVLKTSIIVRLLIPIFCEIGIDINNQYLVTTSILNKFDDNKKRARDKVYKFCELRVNRTLYSDRSMWSFLSKRGEDEDIVINNIKMSLFNEIFVKIDYNKNIVSFFDVIIRNKIKNIFRYKYAVNYKILMTNDRELDERDKTEIHMLRKDNYELLINKLEIEKQCHDIEIPKEFLYLKETNNFFVTKLLNIYFGNDLNPLLATSEEKAKLILLAREELLDYGFTEIPNILISMLDCKNKKVIGKKRVPNNVSESSLGKKFYNIYKDVINIFDKNHPLNQFLTIKNYKLYIPEYYDNIEIDTTLLCKEIMEMCISILD